MFIINKILKRHSQVDRRGSILLACLLVLAAVYALPALAQEPPSYFVPSDLFPTQGTYYGPPEAGVAFASGVVIRNFVHRDLAFNSHPPSLGGHATLSTSGIVDYMISYDGGGTYAPGTSSSNDNIFLDHNTDTGATRHFNTELLQWDFSVGSGGMTRIRESPTLQSLGAMTLKSVTGGDLISSFFDVYLELTLDGGLTWQPAISGPIHLQLYVSGRDIVLTDNMLPPQAYLSKHGRVCSWFNGVMGKDFDLYSWGSVISPPPPGPPVTDNFSCWLTISLSTDDGATWVPETVPATASVQIQCVMLDGLTRFFDMEFLALNASGLPGGIMIRESPTKASLGKHAIQTVTAMYYGIESFFDIFTEISLDGGASWSPSKGPIRLEVFVDPSAIIATAVGGGTITPSGDVYVPYDTDTTFAITANPGYRLSDLNVDGESVTPADHYTFTHVSWGHSITATFSAMGGVSVGTDPEGLAFSVDGIQYTSRQNFSWVPGSAHAIATVSPQGGLYTRYIFTAWSDAGAIAHIIKPAGDSSFTASFRWQYSLSLGATPGGVASADPPSIDSYYDPGTTVGITATPNSGYYFTYWQGSGSGSYSGFDNPSSVTMSGPVTDTANFSNVPHRIGANAGWNMVSMPYSAICPDKDSLFHHATSPLFYYQVTYQRTDTFQCGIGYWLKLSEPESIDVYGREHLYEAVTVYPGWNMIGSIAQPLAIGNIVSDPSGIKTGNFYCYNKGYHNVDTLYPGLGYWVKVTDKGTLYLTNIFVGASRAKQTIRIVPTGEMPPPPPGEEMSMPERAIPIEYALAQAYPNPFNPSTTIKYQLPKDSKVSLLVYNTLGQVVAVLADGIQQAGYKQVQWNAGNIPSGVYIYRLVAGDFIQTKKMLLIR